MREDLARRRAEAYADRSGDSRADDAYEPTYRDGSVKNECWRSDTPAAVRPAKPRTSIHTGGFANEAES